MSDTHSGHESSGHQSSTALSPLADPGLPPHVYRRADTEPRAAKKAERQVAILFALSAVSTVAFVASFVGIEKDAFIFIPLFGSTQAQQLALGMTLALSLFLIGAGAVHWAKTLMPDHEVIQDRHELRSSDEDRQGVIEVFREGAEAAGLGRRSLIKRTLLGSMG